jgi:hypothetical protein
VTTNPDWSAARVRDYYALRTDIEERHRQVKCFGCNLYFALGCAV